MDEEARRALLGLVLRATDEVRFGMRALDLDELEDLARAWSWLNDGATPAEVALRHLGPRNER